MSNNITFTKESAKSLKKAYLKAVNEKQSNFIFMDNEFVTDYAKYVVEYLEGKFGKL
jgi:hypothetical protein